MSPRERRSRALIGEVVADAAVTVARASESYRCHGALDPASRAAGAEALACLARLQLDSLEIPDFAAVALVEGRRVLNRRHGADLPGAAEFGRGNA